jgi:hypothetical protein
MALIYLYGFDSALIKFVFALGTVNLLFVAITTPPTIFLRSVPTGS